MERNRFGYTHGSSSSEGVAMQEILAGVQQRFNSIWNDPVFFEESYAALPFGSTKGHQPVLTTLIRQYSKFVPKNVIVYWAFEAHRLSSDYTYNLRTIQAFHDLCEVFKSIVEEKDAVLQNWPWLESELNKRANDHSEYVPIFMEALDLCSIIKPADNDPNEMTYTTIPDANIVLAKTFGIKCDALGFDHLFGGGLVLDVANSLDRRKPADSGTVTALTETLTDENWQDFEVRPLAGVIRGTQGVGKSLLAFYMALEVARLGGVAVMFTLEQHRLSLLHAFAKFGWLPGDMDLFDLIVEHDKAEQELKNYAIRLESREKLKKGLLIVDAIHPHSLPQLTSLVGRFSSMMQLRPGPKLVVVDSLEASNLSAMLSRLRDKEDWFVNPRDFVDKLFDTATLSGTACIITTEESPNCGNTARDRNAPPSDECFVSDLVIHLGPSEKSPSEYSQRYIEVEKARGQYHLRGRHAFYIDKNEGFKVYPSSTAVHRDRDCRKKPHPSHLNISTGIPVLDKMFPNGKGPLMGSKTALIGPSASAKSEMALIYLLADYFVPHSLVDKYNQEVEALKNIMDVSSPTWSSVKKRVDSYHEMIRATSQCSNDKRSILFTFRDEQSKTEALIEKGFVGKHFINMKLDDLPKPGEKIETKDHLLTWKAANEFIRVVTLRTGYVSPGHILWKIQDAFKGQGEKRSIARVAFDNLAHMELHCPLVASDPSFVTALNSVLAVEGVSSLFVLSDLASVHSQEFARNQAQIQDACDNLIVCQRIAHKGSDHIAIRVAKTVTLSHVPHHMELVKDDRLGLLLEPRLDLMKNIESGTPEPVPIKFVMIRETPAHDRYNDYVSETIRSILCHDVERSDETLDFLYKVLAKSHLCAREELQIIQVHEFQLRRVKDYLQPIPWSIFSRHESPGNYVKGIIDKVCCNQNECDECDFNCKNAGKSIPPEKSQLDRAARDERGGENQGKSIRPKESQLDPDLFAVPYILNLSLLVYQKEFWQDHMDDLTTWTSIVNRLRDGNNAGTKGYFDFTRRSFENYNCLFFEILFSRNPSLSEKGIRDLFCEEKNEKPLLDALRTLNELCYGTPAQDCWEKYHRNRNNMRFESIVATPNIATPKPLEALNSYPLVDPNSVLSRHWFTTINDWFSRCPDKNPRDYGIIPLPGNLTTAGEWYWALPKSTSALEAGISIIDMLMTAEAEFNRLSRGIGLPVRNLHYEKGGNCGFDIRLPEFRKWKSATGASTASDPLEPMNMSDVESIYNSPSSIHRSRFECYAEISQELGFYIKEIVNRPADSDFSRDLKQIRQMLKRRLILIERGCESCYFSRKNAKCK